MPADVRPQVRDQVAVLPRRHVPDGVRHVDGRRARSDRLGEDAHQEGAVRTTGVLRAELDVVDEALGGADGLDRALDHLVRRHHELLLHVDRARGDEGVDAGTAGAFDRLGGAFDVAARRARESGDDHARVLGGDRAGDGADRLEVAVGGDREAGFDDVHAEARELAGDLHLLADVQGDAGRLLAVAQRGVEDLDVRHGDLHGARPAVALRLGAALRIEVALRPWAVDRRRAPERGAARRVGAPPKGRRCGRAVAYRADRTPRPRARRAASARRPPHGRTGTPPRPLAVTSSCPR